MGEKNDKKVHGGKYGSKSHGGVQRDLTADWGNTTVGLGGGSPEILGFKGSGQQKFSFLNPNTGVIVTFYAKNVKEAKRIAKSRGLTAIP